MNPQHDARNPAPPAAPSAPPFELRRDPYGIPHVRAASENALAYGQGYVTAIDRADQIETGRRRATARLAAHTGAGGLAWDRFAVRVRLDDTARRVYAALDTTEQEWLAAYARGVTAGLAHADVHGPDAGSAWRPWTPIGIFLVDHVLFNGFPGVLWRDHVARTLGPVFPDVPPETLCAWLSADGGPGAGSDSGSNAWAVTGAHTATGSPLLAGDPHRALELPGPYQQIRLVCTGGDGAGTAGTAGGVGGVGGREGGRRRGQDAQPAYAVPAYDVVGLAFPGVPGLQHFGFATSAGPAAPGGSGAQPGVAWGITNAMAHHVEVFEERFRRGPEGGWEAEGPDGWEPVASGREIVEIRGGDGTGTSAGTRPGRPSYRESVPWIETPRGVWIATRRETAGTGEPAEPAAAAAAGSSVADSPVAVAGSSVAGPANGSAGSADVAAGSADLTAPTGPVDTPQFTIRWPVRVLADAGVATWRRLLRSRSARDVADAFGEGWIDPVNRVLTADSGGDVFSLTAGRLARREPAERALPVPAWTEAARERPWTRLPEAERVTSGIAVDANERPESDTRVQAAPARSAPQSAARTQQVRQVQLVRQAEQAQEALRPQAAQEMQETQQPEAPEAGAGVPRTGPEAATVPRDRRRRRAAHDLGWSYAPYRADRIRDLLAAPPAGGESPDTQHRLHADTSSGAALALMDLVGIPEGLRDWAGAGAPMDADSTDAARFARWRDGLVRRVAAAPGLRALHAAPASYGEVFAPWFVPEAAIGHGLLRILRELQPDLGPDLHLDGLGRIHELNRPGQLGGLGRIDPDPGSNPDPDPAPDHGGNGETWGDLHTLAPVRIPGGPEIAVPRVPVSGDNDTVRCTGGVPGVSPGAGRGSVARWIWDLSDRRRSRWAVPFGASGRPGDPHATDQHETWADGGTVPIETDWARLEPVGSDIPGTVDRPDRPDRLLHGARGAEVWRTTTSRGVIAAHVLDPVADLDVIHGWVTEPRARFWGLGGLSRDELRATYEFVDSLPTHNAYLMRWEGIPVALVQAYHPEDDPVGRAYPVAEGDLGLHFLRAPVLPDHAGGAGESWAVLGPACLSFLFAAPGTRRLIGEPDARNAAAVTRMTRLGFETGERVHFESPNGPKDAVLACLTRERAGVDRAGTR